MKRARWSVPGAAGRDSLGPISRNGGAVRCAVSHGHKSREAGLSAGAHLRAPAPPVRWPGISDEYGVVRAAWAFRPRNDSCANLRCHDEVPHTDLGEWLDWGWRIRVVSAR